MSTNSPFPHTRWSVVLEARQDSATALEGLCQAYWYPLYVWVRRYGHSPHDAQDLTQEFFARVLEKGWLHGADREKGKFRTFLLVALKRFLVNEWERVRAQKRGGGVTVFSLEAPRAEDRYQAEPAAPEVPADRLYDRRWALTLLEQAIGELRSEFERAGKLADFECLKAYLTAERGGIPYEEIAQTLGMTEGGARVAVHRMRKRFREIFRAAIADTVSSPAEVDEEVRYVAGILSEW